jgi:hypothetical protein
MEPRPPADPPGRGGDGGAGSARRAKFKSAINNVQSVNMLNALGRRRPDKKKKEPRMTLGAEISASQLQHLNKVFMDADEDGNGSLDIEEFVRALGPFFGEGTTREKLTLLFRRMDANLNGEVNWDEFSSFMLLQGPNEDEEETKNNQFQIGSTSFSQSNHHSSVSCVAHSSAHGRYFSAVIDAPPRTALQLYSMLVAWCHL